MQLVIKQIPNLLTLSNLVLGGVAIIQILSGNPENAPILLLIAATCDFLDGFVARLLKVSGDFGKQLDSLADMISFGLAPAVLVYYYFSQLVDHPVFQFIPLLLAAGAGYRLAKFNIDTEQSELFKGVPTPAMTLFFIPLPFLMDQHEWINSELILGFCVGIFTVLMNISSPLLSLKFKSFTINLENAFRYSLFLTFVVLSLVLGWLSLPLTILLYVILSLIYFRVKSIHG